MKANHQLQQFFEPYDEHIQNLAWALRNFVMDTVPQANELIWDNYNAVAIAYSKSEKLKDAFCHIALYGQHVNFGFNRGADLVSTPVILSGKGKLIRHVKVKDFELFPKQEITGMLHEAVIISDRSNSQLADSNGIPKSIVMSISEKKIRPSKKTGIS